MAKGKEYREHLQKWLKVVRKAETNPTLQQMIKEKIKRDPIYFFNDWLWTYDPRKKIKVLPFKLYPFQEEFIKDMADAYANEEPLLVEKSRDMGFSWLVLGFFLWKGITEMDFSAGIGSRKALLVDELGNMKSLMERVRFMISRLPKFLQCGYDPKKNTKMGLIRLPDTNSYFAGEAGDDIGRGDRTSAYLIDEFAHIPRSAMVQAAVSQTSNCIIYGSTPKGKGNEFARLRHKTKIKRSTLHWKNHPEKDQAWYEKQKETMDAATLAQEIDISYTKSQEGKVYKWFDAEKHANKEINYNPNYDIMATCDWGIGDPTAVLFLQYYGGIVHIIGALERKDLEITRIFQDVATYLSKWERHVGHVCAWYGDPDGRNRNIVTGDSVASFIKMKYGINLRFKLPNIIKSRILSVRMLGEHNRIKVDSRLHHLIECFENYRYPDKESGENEKPIHDWTSHSMSALEYYCVYEHGMDQFEDRNRQITTTSFR